MVSVVLRRTTAPQRCATQIETIETGGAKLVCSPRSTFEIRAFAGSSLKSIRPLSEDSAFAWRREKRLAIASTARRKLEGGSFGSLYHIAKCIQNITNIEEMQTKRGISERNVFTEN